MPAALRIFAAAVALALAGPARADTLHIDAQANPDRNFTAVQELSYEAIVAGIGRMSYPRFLSANLVGAATWGSGLVALGYKPAEVTRLLQKVDPAVTTTEELIRHALRAAGN